MVTTSTKLKRKDGTSAHQLMKAIVTAVLNLKQGRASQYFTSLSIRIVMPADAHAALKVTVPVIYRKHQGEKWMSFREKKNARLVKKVICCS